MYVDTNNRISECPTLSKRTSSSHQSKHAKITSCQCRLCLHSTHLFSNRLSHWSHVIFPTRDTWRPPFWQRCSSMYNDEQKGRVTHGPSAGYISWLGRADTSVRPNQPPRTVILFVLIFYIFDSYYHYLPKVHISFVNIRHHLCNKLNWLESNCWI